MSVVFLCIGAAKAGTDWLHSQLSGHPECHFRTIKELHYFDALETGGLDLELKKHRGEQEDIMARLAKSGQAPTAHQARRLADRAAWIEVLEKGGEDVPAYLEYLNGGATSEEIVGEMTPAYALLSEERLTSMARMSQDVRILFQMRDPVERLWSHVRMIAARRDPKGQVNERRCANILARTLAGEEAQIAQRCDYAGTLARLRVAVPGMQLLVDVFEEMIRGVGLLRLCEFLGIAPMTGDAALVHAGQPLAMTGDQRRAAARWLEPQYDAAERVLGRMPSAWQREG